jgi:hypothetical protein
LWSSFGVVPTPPASVTGTLPAVSRAEIAVSAASPPG